MITLEVKHDTKHKKWHKLSVSFLEGMGSMEHRSVLKNNMLLYLDSYAIDHQMNPQMIAIRALNKHGDVIAMRESDATVNRPK
jgi:hypothetical protein